MLRVYWYVHVSPVYRKKKRKEVMAKGDRSLVLCQRPVEAAGQNLRNNRQRHGIQQDENYPQQVYLSNDVQFRFKRTYSRTISLHPRTYESDMMTRHREVLVWQWHDLARSKKLAANLAGGFSCVWCRQLPTVGPKGRRQWHPSSGATRFQCSAPPDVGQDVTLSPNVCTALQHSILYC